MDKDILAEKIKKRQYTHEQLVSWVAVLPASPEKRKPIEYKVGDVLLHTVFKHPYVLLKRRKNDWVCGLLTSEDTCPEILEECQSRFFSTGFFTKTLFTVSKIEGSFVNTYDNSKHLREILKKLKINFLD